MNDIEINKDEWGTPKDLFDRLDHEFKFTIDVASDPANAKCARHYTKVDDGLKQPWAGEVVFCNPPYSGNQIETWVKKAFAERNKAKAIVMILPVRTDRKYFHNHILHHAEIRFLKGRPSFVPLKGQNKGAPSFPSMIVVWRKGKIPPHGLTSLTDFKGMDSLER
jgi:phage N-6-adenine-methyltransferase